MDEHYKYTEPWYISDWILIVCGIAIFATPITPMAGITLLILAFLKVRHAKRYSVRAQAGIQKERETILKEANNTVDELIKEAEVKLAVINEKAADKQAIIDQAREDALSEAISRIKDKQTELDRINAEIEKKDFYIAEISRTKEELESLEKKLVSREEKIDRLVTIQKAVNHTLKTYFKGSTEPYDRYLTLPVELMRDIDELVPVVTLKLHSMDYKDLRRAFRANEKLIDGILERYEGRYSTKTNQAIYRLMVIALRAELQNILYTLTYSKLNDGIEAVKTMTNRYINIAQTGNQTIAATLAKFIGELEYLFIDAVKIEYEYYVKREAAKQEQQELRAQMREEAEERRRLKEQQEQMKKEELKYAAEIENIRQQMATAENDEKTKLLQDRIKELEDQLHSLEEKQEEITRLQNGKAGYVYVISNLGSFGNDVFKVGMTRRLNPQERVDELGDASVPFKFDVHSFIFSEDAVKLESDLHMALEQNRVNKVNARKEFFKVSIDELEGLVDKYDPSAEFNRTMQAEQYHQSLSLVEEEIA